MKKHLVIPVDLPSPRVLRTGLATGAITASDPRIYKTPPTPPPEWPEWRRIRLMVSVRASILFLQGKEWTEIVQILERDGSLMKSNGKRPKGSPPLVSKARTQQYIRRGCDFLMARGCFVKAGVKPPEQ
jgi:hypothetical protein